MKLRLSLPDTFKFIKIVLTVKHLIFKTEIRILIKLGHLILPDSKLIKKQLFAAVAYSSEISARIFYLSINFLQDYCKSFKVYFMLQAFSTPCIIFFFLLPSLDIALYAFYGKWF